MTGVINGRLDLVSSWREFSRKKLLRIRAHVPTQCLVFNLAPARSAEIRIGTHHILNRPLKHAENMTNEIDITIWRCSEKVAQSPTINYSAFRQLMGPDGLKLLKKIIGGAASGAGKQNTYGVLKTDWNTVRSRLNLLVGEEGQGTSTAQFPDDQKGGDTDNGTTRQTDLPEDAVFRCLRAPLTEIAWIEVKAGATLEAVQALLGKYVAYANKESTPPVAAAHGQDVASSEEELFLVVGWNTLEDQKMARESDEVRAILKEMAGVGALEAHTIILQQVVAGL
ncbi:hypothetical protein BJV78DRAFT_350382 [Lactifluus subvellereus]|nr:hypothetical protein BJV78DRAFT_350382 [Lactifluus subvellereus]